jgi:hypothetical protein
VVWGTLYGVLHKEVKKAVGRRREALQSRGLPPQAIQESVEDLLKTWIWFNRLFGFCIGSFLVSVVIDYSNVEIVGYLSTLFAGYGVFSLAMALFETVRVTRFVDNVDYRPRIRFGEVVASPLVLLLQGINGYNLYSIYLALQSEPDLTLFGLLYISASVLSFPAALNFLIKVNRPTAQFRKRDAAAMLTLFLPWIILLGDTLLTHLHVF